MRPPSRFATAALAVVAAAAVLAIVSAGCSSGGNQGASSARERQARMQAPLDAATAAKADTIAGKADPAKTREAGVMQLTSSAFKPEGQIPVRHSCDGQDLSPPLAWSGAPAGTVGYALICEDPDAPVGTWDHWVLYAIPADRSSLPEGIAKDAQLPDGLRQGLNGWKKPGYGGPCPPPGKAHRYFFRLYALGAPVDLPPGATKARVMKAIEGKVLATGSLMGTFKR